MTLTNNTDTEYIGSMFPRIIKSDSNDLVAWGSSIPVQLTGSQTMLFEYVGTLTPSGNTTPEAGSYRLYFYSQQSNKAVGDTISVTLAERPANTAIDVTDFKFDGIQAGDIAKFSWTVTCTQGYYDDSMTVYLLAAGDQMLTYRSVSIYLNQGESKNATIEIPLGEYDYGNYTGALRYDNKIQQRIPFSYVQDATSTKEIASPTSKIDIYDLQGRKVSKPIGGHLYIHSGRLIKL